MNAETIKDFLVSLGFSVDDAGAKKFGSVLAGTTANVIKMGLAVEGAALSVVAFTAKIASGLDNLYWASQRTGATVQGIQSIGYAVSQVGGSVDAARGSLESLARFIRNNPGAEGFLNRLGVQTRDASGNMRDMAAIFTGVGQKLSSMPYYRANQYAQMLGIDENTLMAMRRGVGGFSGQYSAMAKAIGFNADEAARSSNKFMTSLREFGAMAGMARDKIGSNLAGGLAGSLDTLRRHILDNFPRIEQTLTKAIKGILAIGDIIGRLFFRLIEGTPASDNNNTTAYIRAVSQRLGVDPRAALNMSDPQTMSALMSSIIQHENGRNIYSRELINKAAVAGISGKMTEVNQQNTYHIYGGGDPHAVGNEVARRQQSANAQVMRSNQVRVG
ncbi:lytic transglycosylase [Escherichia coli]|uniref:lytic transglycosylase n=1 Tax=Escherichia coli TaxID=562 RepID=UPI00129982E0|nr:lytic transglycosylase [Escherichia coli]MRG18653.1 lytic transglycosylase [Escherichia coli]